MLFGLFSVRYCGCGRHTGVAISGPADILAGDIILNLFLIFGQDSRHDHFHIFSNAFLFIFNYVRQLMFELTQVDPNFHLVCSITKRSHVLVTLSLQLLVFRQNHDIVLPVLVSTGLGGLFAELLSRPREQW